MFLIFLLVPSSFALTGGPDGYGYTYSDSKEPGSSPFNWVSIEETGIQADLDDNSVSETVPIGFNFNFYGVYYKNLYI